MDPTIKRGMVLSDHPHQNSDYTAVILKLIGAMPSAVIITFISPASSLDLSTANALPSQVIVVLCVYGVRSSVARCEEPKPRRIAVFRTRLSQHRLPQDNHRQST